MKKIPSKIKNICLENIDAVLLIALCFMTDANIFIYIVVALLFVAYIVFLRKKFYKKIVKFLPVLLIILFILDVIYFIILQTNIMQYLSSVHEIKNFILSTNEWGVCFYCLIQILQIIVLPIPGFLIILAGVNIYGVWDTILISGITIIVGSCISFIIGKIYGSKAITFMVGEKSYNEYKNVLNHKTKRILSMMFILPFFPDDLLCLLAGTTSLKFYEFLIISIFTRPLSIIVTALLGDYIQIMFKKYSIGVIIFYVLFFGIVLFLILKNKNKIINKVKKIAKI